MVGFIFQTMLVVLFKNYSLIVVLSVTGGRL